MPAPGDAARTEDARRVVADAVRRYGRLDLLVANAGGHGVGTVADTSDDIVAFLLSDDSAAMTGSVVTADAGASATDLPTIAFADYS